MKNNAVKSDERTAKITGRAAAVTLILLWAALVIVGIYKTVKYGAGSTTEEILLFLGSLLVFLILKHRKESVDLPKDFFGRPPPTAPDGKDKRVRIKAYVVDSLLNGVLLAALNVGLNQLNRNFSFTTIDCGSVFLTILVNGAMDIAVISAVFMLINYIWGEHNIKKYNAMLAEEDEV